MMIFLNTYHSRVWSAIVDSYTQPDKPISEWTPTEADAHKFNFMALNVIASVLAPYEFRMIAHLKMVKEAWNFLSFTHEGTSTVKMSKLQMYMALLEALRMEEDEEIS